MSLALYLQFSNCTQLAMVSVCCYKNSSKQVFTFTRFFYSNHLFASIILELVQQSCWLDTIFCPKSLWLFISQYLRKQLLLSLMAWKCKLNLRRPICLYGHIHPSTTNTPAFLQSDNLSLRVNFNLSKYNFWVNINMPVTVIRKPDQK